MGRRVKERKNRGRKKEVRQQEITVNKEENKKK